MTDKPLRLLLSLAAVGILLVSCDAVGLRLSRVPSGSMEPTFSKGDLIWWKDISDNDLKRIKVGDVVVYRDSSISAEPLLKRVVGLAGDVVEIRGDKLIVNGATPVGQWATRECASRQCNFGPATVPPDHLFVLGDNWERSSDSRNAGPVPVQAVVGKVIG